ncbi:uncharacterized protein [Clytia hemisphaerica]|uniref:uncharacterized protein n=1 Tax=Clytia hemisphaerica TaxID=252671 RepID=UPI0034D6FDEF
MVKYENDEKAGIQTTDTKETPSKPKPRKLGCNTPRRSGGSMLKLNHNAIGSKTTVMLNVGGSAAGFRQTSPVKKPTTKENGAASATQQNGSSKIKRTKSVKEKRDENESKENVNRNGFEVSEEKAAVKNDRKLAKTSLTELNPNRLIDETENVKSQLSFKENIITIQQESGIDSKPINNEGIAKTGLQTTILIKPNGINLADEMSQESAGDKLIDTLENHAIEDTPHQTDPSIATNPSAKSKDQRSGRPATKPKVTRSASLALRNGSRPSSPAPKMNGSRPPTNQMKNDSRPNNPTIKRAMSMRSTSQTRLNSRPSSPAPRLNSSLRSSSQTRLNDSRPSSPSPKLNSSLRSASQTRLNDSRPSSPAPKLNSSLRSASQTRLNDSRPNSSSPKLNSSLRSASQTRLNDSTPTGTASKLHRSISASQTKLNDSRPGSPSPKLTLNLRSASQTRLHEIKSQIPRPTTPTSPGSPLHNSSLSKLNSNSLTRLDDATKPKSSIPFSRLNRLKSNSHSKLNDIKSSSSNKPESHLVRSDSISKLNQSKSTSPSLKPALMDHKKKRNDSMQSKRVSNKKSDKTGKLHMKPTDQANPQKNDAVKSQTESENVQAQLTLEQEEINTRHKITKSPKKLNGKSISNSLIKVLRNLLL